MRAGLALGGLGRLPKRRASGFGSSYCRCALFFYRLSHGVMTIFRQSSSRASNAR